MTDCLGKHLLSSSDGSKGLQLLHRGSGSGWPRVASASPLQRSTRLKAAAASVFCAIEVLRAVTPLLLLQQSLDSNVLSQSETGRCAGGGGAASSLVLSWRGQSSSSSFSSSSSSAHHSGRRGPVGAAWGGIVFAEAVPYLQKLSFSGVSMADDVMLFRRQPDELPVFVERGLFKGRCSYEPVRLVVPQSLQSEPIIDVLGALKKKVSTQFGKLKKERKRVVTSLSKWMSQVAGIELRYVIFDNVPTSVEDMANRSRQLSYTRVESRVGMNILPQWTIARLFDELALRKKQRLEFEEKRKNTNYVDAPIEHAIGKLSMERRSHTSVVLKVRGSCSAFLRPFFGATALPTATNLLTVAKDGGTLTLSATKSPDPPPHLVSHYAKPTDKIPPSPGAMTHLNPEPPLWTKKPLPLSEQPGFPECPEKLRRLPVPSPFDTSFFSLP